MSNEYSIEEMEMPININIAIPTLPKTSIVVFPRAFSVLFTFKIPESGILRTFALFIVTNESEDGYI